MPNAVAALVLFALVLPLGCLFFGFLASFTLAGATPTTDEAHDLSRGLFIAATISALIAIGMALASAIVGTGVGVRVVATVAILSALVTGGFAGLMILSVPRGEVDSGTDTVEPVAPACGPDSHPVIFGGDSRYEACPDDIASAEQFLDSAVTLLPIEKVTAASVDAVASGIESEVYEGTIEFDNGDIVVAWYPAAVTCAIATWRDGAWSPEVRGMLAEGGCIYIGG